MFHGNEELIDETKIIFIGKNKLKVLNSAKLLGITIDNKLNFVSHISNLCKEPQVKSLLSDGFVLVLIQRKHAYCTVLIFFPLLTTAN